MGTYGKLWSYTMYIILFAMGIVLFMSQLDSIITNKITDSSTQFIDECRTTGVIDADNFHRFCNNIYTLGNYEIEIEHSSLRYYPDSAEGWRAGYYTYTLDDILAAMYPGDGRTETDYQMKSGDTITIRVTRLGRTISENIMSGIFGVESSPRKMLVNYSGNIGNSGN